MLVKAVNELDFNSLFIRPTGISGLTGGGISPAKKKTLLEKKEGKQKWYFVTKIVLTSCEKKLS